MYFRFSGKCYIVGPIGATGCCGCQGPAPPRDPEEERRREEAERRRAEEYKRRYKSGVVVTVTTPTGPLYDSFRKLTIDYQIEHPEERLQVIAREPRTESTRTPKPECGDIDQRNQRRAKRDASIERLIEELEELGYQNGDLDYGRTLYPEEETIPDSGMILSRPLTINMPDSISDVTVSLICIRRSWRKDSTMKRESPIR